MALSVHIAYPCDCDREADGKLQPAAMAQHH